MSKKLSPRERRFIEHRAKGLNGAEAIRAMGFTGRRPDHAASKLMKKPHVKEALDQLLAKLAAKAEVSQEDWFREVWAVASAKVKKITGADKGKALELAGRALGAFKDTAGERETIGPGLTIIIQQGGATQQLGNGLPLAPGVTLMPGPER
jgi:hypothetical protein